MLAERAKTPLEAVIVFLKVLVLDKVRVFLIDAVVGQVVEKICLCVFVGVLLACKSNKPFLVDVDAKRVDRGNAHIDSKVKFVPVDQQGVSDVALNDC